MVLTKLRPMIPKFPEARLIWAVVEQAILDLALGNEEAVKSARKFLNGRLWHAELVGIDPDYVRRVIDMVGLER